MCFIIVKLLRRLTALVCVLAAFLKIAQAVAPTSQEYPLKAAFIYNFAMFTEWPNDASDPSDALFVIGILGEDPFGTAMDRAVEGKKIKGRPVVIKRLNWGSSLRDCHILFVSSSEKSKLAELDHVVAGRSILTISEGPAFAKQGGIISFFLEENKIRFEINVEAAKRANLQLSSKLLSLAKIVK